MSYTIQLTNKEISTLAWAKDRGYFPQETYDGMYPADGQNGDDDNSLLTWVIPEQVAWHIYMQRAEDPHSLFACIGGDLLERLLALEESIV